MRHSLLKKAVTFDDEDEEVLLPDEEESDDDEAPGELDDESELSEVEPFQRPLACR